METPNKICKCGCGTEISALNNWEYKRGHAPKGKKAKKAKPDPDVEVETEPDQPYASLELCEEQLDAAWAMFSLNQKAHAIVHGLNTERE
jgi:hypothetical protein